MKHPVFLAGDMNAEPESEEMQLLRKKWTDLTDREYTYHTDKPEIKIDYIYARPADEIEFTDTRVCKEVRLSDHFPVISWVKIK